MYSLKQAKNYAQNIADLKREPWQVFKVPANAPAMRYPGNVHNTGVYLAAAVSDRADYEAGGAVFIGEPFQPRT